MSAIRVLVWVLGGLAGLVALLFGAVAVLGHAGVLADVGEQENRQIGQQAMWMAVGAGALCIVISLLGWRLQRGAREMTGPRGHEMATPLPYAGYAPSLPKPPTPARRE